MQSKKPFFSRLSQAGDFIQKYILNFLSPTIVIVAIVWHLFFTEINYLDICRNDDKIRALQQEIDREEARIAELQKEIRNSKSDAATIDRIAREKHGMQRTHEDVYVTILPPDTLIQIIKD